MGFLKVIIRGESIWRESGSSKLRENHKLGLGDESVEGIYREQVVQLDGLGCWNDSILRK